ncbi:SRPBCC family protein [Gordonia humi]|uniref:Polyketide cyclase n=1 Tax=Gordonia humi TaxID=686429 RepID=A0A840F172_9ACTN|nr:SRPBCC family protein [Gordonia humi]MBB4136268.1 hypothetical protein [Gordonia humi]
MSDHTKVTVQKVISAPVEQVFAVLRDPANHVGLDGSGFVRGVDSGGPIQQVGDVFTMNMYGEHLDGDYQTDNYVTAYDENARLAWKTAVAGTQPPGWEWIWEFESAGPDTTTVRHTYDWSGVTDTALLEQLNFPFVTVPQLEDTLSRLAAAV